MYIIPDASPWLTKNIEKYVNGDFSNEDVIRYNFWADCIRYTFKENKIEISEILPDFDIKITEHSTGFDLMCEMNDVDLERFVDLFLKEMSLINKYDFDNLTEQDCIELIEEKIKKDKEKILVNWESDQITIEKGRWGKIYVIKGKKRVPLSKNIDPLKISISDAKDILKIKK